MGLDTVELLVRIEDEFEVEIADTEASEIYTVGELYNCVLRKVAERNQNISTVIQEPDWQRFCGIIVDQLGVKPEIVTPSASFKNDLRVD